MVVSGRPAVHPPTGLVFQTRAFIRTILQSPIMINQTGKKIEERILNTHNGLDLGFSDYFQDQNVRDRTISKKLGAIERAVCLLEVEEGMNFSLFQALGPEHPSPQIYILDFPSDLRAAFYRILAGYHRPSILSLRNWLEMRLLGIYFGPVEHPPKTSHHWNQGNFMPPSSNLLFA